MLMNVDASAARLTETSIDEPTRNSFFIDDHSTDNQTTDTFMPWFAQYQ